MVIIGRMTATNSKDYPFIISDDSGTKLWVESTGYIINEGDKRVGFIKVRE